MEERPPTHHRMDRRCAAHDYTAPGIYHITIVVADASTVFSRLHGDPYIATGQPGAPWVELTPLGAMVEDQLLHAISAHYPMMEVQDHVIMPDHLHFIIEAHDPIVSRGGKAAHLGQIIAGFKKGCNRGFWALIGTPAPLICQGKPDSTNAFAQRSARVPSSASTGRAPLFNYGYTDVMPLRRGQLATQRHYIQSNPRMRLLLASDGTITCDTFGDRRLLAAAQLLPIVCHRRDAARHAEHKWRALDAARQGAVLVSARIARGEQDIIDSAMEQGFPVVLIRDNGFPDRYHPSDAQILRCADGQLLLVSPWSYAYRPADASIDVPQCKTMNCVAQALCRRSDAWWKE